MKNGKIEIGKNPQRFQLPIYLRIIRSALYAEDIPPAGMTVKTIGGRQVMLLRSDRHILVEGFRTFRSNFIYGQTVVHIIAGVLGQSNRKMLKEAHQVTSKPQTERMTCSNHGWIGTAGCLCAALYAGENCSSVKQIGRNILIREYDGDIVLSKHHLASRLQALTVNSPGRQLSILEQISAEVRQQLSEILPLEDAVRARRFATCALVGSSGILLRSAAGGEIDSHDMVLRFNAAPTRAYERHVGTRTTYRICNGEHLNFREGNETVIHHLKATSFLAKLLLYSRAGHQGAPPLVFDPDFTSYVSTSMTATPSSGYFAVLLALQVCHRISLYGFSVSERHGARHHYYNSEAPSNAGRDDREFDTIKQLASAELVRFAEPCIVECHESQASCQECLGETPLDELAARERWSPEQILANELHRQAWEEAQRWDWPLQEAYGFSEQRGVFRRRQRGESAAREPEGSGRRQHASRFSFLFFLSNRAASSRLPCPGSQGNQPPVAPASSPRVTT
uniref:Beta-galactoside alpha-2,3-sialyltransferase (Sialyltransferase 4A) n=2 Tax=Tetraselmis sp. GSL018 TaxID=582737 RepID=A0A061SDD0_9CHLO